nr:putative reverse transcriptase domain-containing protein [Tanacetum cinerariifolium]
MLKVSPLKGDIHFGKWGKLNSRYIRPFKKCLSDESLVIPLDEIHIDEKLHFIEEPGEIMDREVKRLKQSHIRVIKVRWNLGEAQSLLVYARVIINNSYVGTRGSISEEVSVPIHKLHTFVNYHDLSFGDKALLTEEDCDNP